MRETLELSGKFRIWSAASPLRAGLRLPAEARALT